VGRGRPGTQASTGYTVDGATPSKPPSPAPSRKPSAAPSTDTVPAIADGDESSPPAAIEPPAPTPAVAAAAGSQPAVVGWALVFGSGLVLAGAAIFGTMLVRSRRERKEFPDS
jgi:hypothetical protein